MVAGGLARGCGVDPVTQQPLGDDRFETLFHGGAMVSRMFPFAVLE